MLYVVRGLVFGYESSHCVPKKEPINDREATTSTTKGKKNQKKYPIQRSCVLLNVHV